MTDDSAPESAQTGEPVMLATARLVGFSPRDNELLRVFLRRPSSAGTSLEVTDALDADVLIANMSQPESVMAVRRFKQPGRTIGLVQQFASDAAYYQVQQNSQLLYSLAQGINRLREGWYPPHLVQHHAAPAPALPPAEESSPSANTEFTSTDDAPAQLNSEPAVATPAPSEAAAALPPVEIKAAPRDNQESLPWQRKLSILVIDDSKFSRVSIQDALVKIGFNVDTAVDGEEGVRMAGVKVYDVALIDFEMPGIKGPETIRRLRLLGINTPQLLIMLTSRTGAVDRLRAKLAGCDAYLTKPTKMSEFVAVLTQFASQGKLKRG